MDYIEKLYAAFEDAPFPSDLIGCKAGCCLSSSELEELFAISKREMPEDQIRKAAVDVFVSVADADAFIYILPRIIEVELQYNDVITDYETFAERLHRAGFLNWSAERKEVCHEFLRKCTTKSKRRDYHVENLINLAKHGKQITRVPFQERVATNSRIKKTRNIRAMET